MGRDRRTIVPATTVPEVRRNCRRETFIMMGPLSTRLPYTPTTRGRYSTRRALDPDAGGVGRRHGARRLVRRALVPSQVHRQRERAPAQVADVRAGAGGPLRTLRRRHRRPVLHDPEELTDRLCPLVGDAAPRDAGEPLRFAFLSRKLFGQLHDVSTIPGLCDDSRKASPLNLKVNTSAWHVATRRITPCAACAARKHAPRRLRAPGTIAAPTRRTRRCTADRPCSQRVQGETSDEARVDCHCRGGGGVPGGRRCTGWDGGLVWRFVWCAGHQLRWVCERGPERSAGGAGIRREAGRQC